MLLAFPDCLSRSTVQGKTDFLDLKRQKYTTANVCFRFTTARSLFFQN